MSALCQKRTFANVFLSPNQNSRNNLPAPTKAPSNSFSRNAYQKVTALIPKIGIPTTGSNFSLTSIKLRSYHVAFRMVGLKAEPIDNKRAKNRAENSHQPVRRRQRKMQKFKSPGCVEKFLNIQSATYNTVYLHRHLLKRATFKQYRAKPLEVGKAHVLLLDV